jgi:oligopeptide transport system ATP-binding protein
MSQPTNNNPLLRISGLKTYFPVRTGWLGRKQYVRAVDGVDLAVHRGQTLGLVGESGSGKTTVGRSILRLVDVTDGKIEFDGQSVLAATGREMKPYRRRMQMIFQDPASSLDPRATVGGIIAEPLRVHFNMTRRQRRQRVEELLDKVGLAPQYINRYPHEFSGGQRQRIGIARALATQPDFIVCDEPVSALDVSIQAQILNLLDDLQDEMNLSYLFIAHNLSVVEHFADTVAVMYLGRIVEIVAKDRILNAAGKYENLRHPYTHALLSAVPVIADAGRSTRVRLPGEVPSPMNPPTGCPFHPRCPLTRQQADSLPNSQTATINTQGESVCVVRRCIKETPTLQPTADAPDHLHACLLRQNGHSPT